MWTFMVSDRRFGSKKIVSKNYDEAYMITTRGTWVPEKDAKWLETIKWRCPQCGDRVKVFGRGNPTAAQMASMPTRRPKRKVKPKTRTRRRSKPKVEEPKLEVSVEPTEVSE